MFMGADKASVIAFMGALRTGFCFRIAADVVMLMIADCALSFRVVSAFFIVNVSAGHFVHCCCIAAGFIMLMCANKAVITAHMSAGRSSHGFHITALAVMDMLTLRERRSRHK